MQCVFREIRKIKFTQLRQTAMLQEIRNAVCSAVALPVATAAANASSTTTASSSNSAGR